MRRVICKFLTHPYPTIIVIFMGISLFKQIGNCLLYSILLCAGFVFIFTFHIVVLVSHVDAHTVALKPVMRK